MEDSRHQITIWPENQGRLLGEAGLPEIVPPSIGYDPAVQAVAAAIEEEIGRFAGNFSKTLLWPAIHILEEPLLTHLALMLHVDWWDETWTAEAKRAFLFRQLLLHLKKGTSWAVEEAVNLVYAPAQVREWFEYGGPPGCFWLYIDIPATGLSVAELAKIWLMVEKYKRKSQHVCRFSLVATTSGTAYLGSYITTEPVIDLYPFMAEEVVPPPAPSYRGAAVETGMSVTV